MSGTKFFQIHIGKGHTECPALNGHDKAMKEADKEKYLGIIVDKTGSIDQCGTNIIFLDDWISEYIFYHRYWTNEYPNIFVTIDIGRMNIQIYSAL